MTTIEQRVRLALFTFMFLLSSAYTWEARDFARLASYAPRFAGSIAMALFAAVAIREAVRMRRTKRADDRTYTRSMEYVDHRGLDVATLKAGASYMASIVAFAVGIWAFGLELAAPIFVGVFLAVHRGSSRVHTALSVVGTMVFLWVFERVGLVWPQGSLFN